MWINKIHEKILNFDWLRAVQFFEIQCYYLGFLIGLKYETITKRANKMSRNNEKNIWRDFFILIIIIIFPCILLISNSMVSRAI